ncbi:MAG: 3-isopropylmalate dehydratase small subunit [Candidatus Omnitrophota bacterium]
MILKGNVHKLGDDINTDDIISAKYLVSSDAAELGRHCLESIRPDFVKEARAGDIIVAGRNFGCGSSREHAPLSIKGCGIAAVIAESFAAIFFRNAINIGLPFLELKKADLEKIGQGDELVIDLTSGIIENKTRLQLYKTGGFPEFLEEIIRQKGLINWVKSKKESAR